MTGFIGVGVGIGIGLKIRNLFNAVPICSCF
jgi:hypothetical protein